MSVSTPTPLLIVIAGPARGRTVPVVGSLSIGRDEQSSIAIADPALSRQHCSIQAIDGGVVLKDLESKNGVFVNGCPVTERVLADGDQIRLGDSALVVMIPNQRLGRERSDSSLALDDTPAPTTSMIATDAARNRYLDASRTRATKDLGLLLRLSASLQEVSTVEALHDLLLTHALEVGPVDAAAVLARVAGDDQLTIVTSKTVPGGAATVNRVIAERALDERLAVLANDVSTMCVPLIGSDSVPGVLCVTGSGGSTSFTQDSLQLMAAIGSIGGVALERMRQLEWLRGENARLRTEAAIEHNLVGESAPIQAVYRFVARVAPTDATVLLQGESGTGKELVAAAIHRNSARAQGPFVPINCAALPEGLLESELFGHERGAFTGAIAQQRGRLELADRGTVFLDEIGELAPALQAKLLRVLQDQVVERVGSRRGLKIDVRVIAATNRDLVAGMAAGTFRHDLYYRLNVVSLLIPPLRERADDLPLLSAYFVRQHAARCKRLVKGISPAARKLIAAYDWPGNVRELSNAIERAVVLGSSDVILPEDLPEAVVDAATDESSPRGFHALVAATKREIIRDALQRSGSNVAQAARELGLQSTYLHRLIRNLGIRHE